MRSSKAADHFGFKIPRKHLTIISLGKWQKSISSRYSPFICNLIPELSKRAFGYVARIWDWEWRETETISGCNQGYWNFHVARTPDRLAFMKHWIELAVSLSLDVVCSLNWGNILVKCSIRTSNYNWNCPIALQYSCFWFNTQVYYVVKYTRYYLISN